MKDGYKRTLAGIIPCEWEFSKLENLVDKITDGTHKTPTYTGEGIPFLRVTDIQKNTIDFESIKYISKEEHLDLIKRCNPEIGDILYSKNGTIGIPKIIDWEFNFSIFVSLCLIKVKKENSRVNTKFLEQYLKSESCYNQIRLRAKQGTVTNLHLEEIRDFTIPIPPLKEQQKIAEILSTVDSQIDDTDKLIEKTKELKKGLMQRILTKGIGHTQFKMTEIGEIPVEWGFYLFGEIVEKIVGGGTPSRKIEEYFTGNIPWATVKDLDGSFYKNDTKEHITYEAIKNSATNLIEEGKVIIATRMGLGRGFINSVPMTINQDLKAIYSKRNIDNQFLMFWFLNCGSEIEAMGKGSTVKGITLEELKSFKIAVPPLNEQEKIANILLSVDSEIEEFENKRTKLKELKKGLMQQLLTGMIRVV